MTSVDGYIFQEGIVAAGLKFWKTIWQRPLIQNHQLGHTVQKNTIMSQDNNNKLKMFIVVGVTIDEKCPLL